MKALRLASAFNRDLRRIERRNYNRGLLEAVVDALRAGEQPPRARRDHPLKGEWAGWRECHIQPDWLLIYKATDAEVLLARTGTHADLFGS